MGTTHGCTLERFAAFVSLVRHLLAAVRRVVGRRRLGRSLASIGHYAGRAGPHQLGGRLCRRHVCLGKKRGDLVGPTKRGKGTKLMLLVDGAGLPLAIDIESARCAEVRLIEPLLDQAVTPFIPDRLIYDRAADSDPLRTRLAQRDVELICPHRPSRVRPPAVKYRARCESRGPTTDHGRRKTNLHPQEALTDCPDGGECFPLPKRGPKVFFTLSEFRHRTSVSALRSRHPPASLVCFVSM